MKKEEFFEVLHNRRSIKQFAKEKIPYEDLLEIAKKNNYPIDFLPEIIQRSVVQELERLGLADLIPELMQQVKREFSGKNDPGKMGELPPELKGKIQQGQQEIAKVYADGATMQKTSAAQTPNSIVEQK